MTGTSAAAVVNDVRDAVQHDEIVTAASSALSACEEGIFAWLTADKDDQQDDSRRTEDDGRQSGKAAPTGGATRAGRGTDESVLTDLKSFLQAHPEETVQVTWRVMP